MDNKVRFLIVRFGNIGSRHAAQIAANPAAELVGMCDTNVQQTARAGVPAYIICSPSTSHFSVICHK